MKSLLAIAISLALCQSIYAQCLSKDDKNQQTNPNTKDILYAGQQAFTLNLFGAVNAHHPKENIFFSPFSIYQALLMAYFAAGNNTEANLKKALLLGNETKLDIMKSYKFDQFLRSAHPSESYQFDTANKIYVAPQLPVRDCMLTFFQSELEKLDFKTNATGARKHINQWVSDTTRNNINDLIPENGIDTDTQMVIANAAYFKGLWSSKFQADTTKKEVFFMTPNNQTFVDMMKQKGKFNHAISEELGAHILEMPYKGDDVSMFVLLPPFANQNGVDNILSKLTAATLEEIVEENALLMRQVEVHFPKFSLEKSLPLKDVLNTMGVGDLFEPTSDFSWLTGAVGPHFNDATHKAKIRVDEDGTVASAATAIFSFRSSRPTEPTTFNCNHPFVYFIYDRPTRSITFMGVYRDPKNLS